MNVQYTQDHEDEYGQKFKKGWTAAHTDAEGQRRIDLGVCMRVSDEARARKQAFVIEDCVTPPGLLTAAAKKFSHSKPAERKTQKEEEEA